LISRDTYIEITKFSIVGFICFGLDLGIYYALSQFSPTWFAKAIGFGFGVFANYNLNKFWTWGHRDRSGQRFARYMTLYGISGFVNILSNEMFLRIIPNREVVMSLRNPEGVMHNLFAFKADKITAVILAAAVTMVINFVGQKKWVFSRK